MLTNYKAGVSCSRKVGESRHSDDRNGNEWLYNPILIKTSRFQKALRLRGCMTSDKITMNKVVPQRNVNAGNSEPAMNP